MVFLGHVRRVEPAYDPEQIFMEIECKCRCAIAWRSTFVIRFEVPRLLDPSHVVMGCCDGAKPQSVMGTSTSSLPKLLVCAAEEGAKKLATQIAVTMSYLCVSHRGIVCKHRIIHALIVVDPRPPAYTSIRHIVADLLACS